MHLRINLFLHSMQHARARAEHTREIFFFTLMHDMHERSFRCNPLTSSLAGQDKIQENALPPAPNVHKQIIKSSWDGINPKHSFRFIEACD
jgi:hypothetical protein